MKRTLVAAALLAAFGAANALPTIQFNTVSTGTRTEAFNLSWLTLATGTTLNLGYLSATGPGTTTYTYLGQESGFKDKLLTLGSPTKTLTEQAGTEGIQSISDGIAAAGNLAFEFEGDVGKFAVNGPASGWAFGTSIGLIGSNMTVLGKPYQFVLGYNDSAGSAALGDWDDFVIGVNFVPSAVPEPETYALLLAGLGAVGFLTRRRRAA